LDEESAPVVTAHGKANHTTFNHQSEEITVTNSLRRSKSKKESTNAPVIPRRSSKRNSKGVGARTTLRSQPQASDRKRLSKSNISAPNSIEPRQVPSFTKLDLNDKIKVMFGAQMS
jgi:hypothetical protein